MSAPTVHYLPRKGGATKCCGKLRSELPWRDILSPWPEDVTCGKQTQPSLVRAERPARDSQDHGNLGKRRKRRGSCPRRARAIVWLIRNDGHAAERFVKLMHGCAS